MEQDNLLKLNIQYFAEPGGEPGTDPAGGEPGANQDPNQDPNKDPNAEPSGDNTEKVLEKLKARIGKEQAEKNETKTQLEQALSRIQELEQGNKGNKGIKEKSAEEKLAEAQKQKDDEIAVLRKQIKLSDMTQEADEVLKEGGLVVPKEVLGLIVSEDETKTYDNVKTLLTFLEGQQQAWETKRNTGTTPKKTGAKQGTVTTEQFNAMTYLEKAKLASEQPENFKKITGGH